MMTAKYGINNLGGNSEEGKYAPGSCNKSWFSKKQNCMGRHVEKAEGWTPSVKPVKNLNLKFSEKEQNDNLPE